MTIATSLLIGLRAPWAVNFSLLLSAPTILAALVWESRHLSTSWLSANAASIALGAIVSAVVGWLSIALLARCATRNQWAYFAVYLWSAAAVGWCWLSLRA
jgi:undecaprenyl pyrophosphate phosphatase UppP